MPGRLLHVVPRRLLQSGRLKYVAVGVLLLLILVFQMIPSLQSSFSTHSQTSAQGQPHFLYRSRFRSNPDLDYENHLSIALDQLERNVSTGSEGPPNTLWQVYLARELATAERGDDSIQLEQKNPEWNYQLVSGHWADDFVTNTLSSIPDLATFWHSYPQNVHRGDLLRYLLLWYYGGYYADMDVFPAQSIKACPSLQNSIFTPDDPDISLVVGIELDEPFASPGKMRHWHWDRAYGFNQYTFFAPRRFSPILREVIVRVLAHTKRHIEESNFLLGVRYNEKTTREVTGPTVFTDAILDVLSDALPGTHRLMTQSIKADAGVGSLDHSTTNSSMQRVTWAPFHRIKTPLCTPGSEARTGKQFGGLCVLPINAWGNGQRHSGAEDFRTPEACINHRFGGTWKKGKER